MREILTIRDIRKIQSQKNEEIKWFYFIKKFFNSLNK